MLNVFFGNDTETVREKAMNFAADKENPEAVIERIDTDVYVSGMLTDLSGATSLFGSESRYVLDTPSDNTEFFAEVIEHLPALAESPNTFVVIEDKLLAPEKKKFTKHAATIEEYKKPAEERFNAFGMADSLAKKDKRQLWVQLQEARLAGLSAEEIIGTLWWQIKSLRLAESTGSAKEAGMKDFPYNKAKRALKNFSGHELESLSQSIIGLYHDGHRSVRDIDLALEKWVLTI